MINVGGFKLCDLILNKTKQNKKRTNKEKPTNKGIDIKPG